MKQVWTKNKKEFEESKAFRRLLNEILIEKLRTKHAESRSKDGYANPSWPYFQADAIGYERAITEIQSILED